MGKGLVTDTSLAAIADSIRAKNGESTKYKPSDMATAIDNLPSGGAAPSNAILVDLPPATTASGVVAGDLISVSAGATHNQWAGTKIRPNGNNLTTESAASYITYSYSPVAGGASAAMNYGGMTILYTGSAPSQTNFAICGEFSNIYARVACINSTTIIARGNSSASKVVVANTSTHKSRESNVNYTSGYNAFCRLSDTSALDVSKISGGWGVRILSIGNDLSVTAGTLISLGLSSATYVPNIIELSENLAVVIQTTSSKTIFVPVVISSSNITIGTALEVSSRCYACPLDSNSIVVSNSGTNNYSLARFTVSSSISTGTEYAIGSTKSAPISNRMLVLGNYICCASGAAVDVVSISGSTFSLTSTSESVVDTDGGAFIKRNAISFYYKTSMGYSVSQTDRYMGFSRFVLDTTTGTCSLSRYNTQITSRLHGCASIDDNTAICHYIVNMSVTEGTSVIASGGGWASFLVVSNNVGTLTKQNGQIECYPLAGTGSDARAKCYAIGSDKVLVASKGGSKKKITLSTYEYSSGLLSLVDTTTISDTVDIAEVYPPELLKIDDTRYVLPYNKNSVVCCRVITVDNNGSIVVGEETQGSLPQIGNLWQPVGCVVGNSVFFLSGSASSQKIGRYDVSGDQISFYKVYTLGVYGSLSAYTSGILNMSNNLVAIGSPSSSTRLSIGRLTLDDDTDSANWTVDAALTYITKIKTHYANDSDGYTILVGALNDVSRTNVFIHAKYINGNLVCIPQYPFITTFANNIDYVDSTYLDTVKPMIRIGESSIVRFKDPLSILPPQNTTLRLPNGVAKTGYVDSSTNISAYLFDA